MKGVILLGGGIDSTAVLVWLRKMKPEVQLTALHIDYGQKALRGEINSVAYFCQKYGVTVTYADVSLNVLAKSAILKGTEVGKLEEQNCLDGRNITLIAMAATYASAIGANRVYVGFHQENFGNFPDATLGALEAMQNVVEKAYKYRLTLEAPLQQYSRLEIARLGMAMEPELMKKSFTCYEGGLKECGKCIHCYTKATILEKLTCAE